jgi:hypothetical protein
MCSKTLLIRSSRDIYTSLTEVNQNCHHPSEFPLYYKQQSAKRCGIYSPPPVHLREEAYSPLGRMVFRRVRSAAAILSANLRKIHVQDLPSLAISSACS